MSRVLSTLILLIVAAPVAAAGPAVAGGLAGDAADGVTTPERGVDEAVTTGLSGAGSDGTGVTGSVGRNGSADAPGPGQSVAVTRLGSGAVRYDLSLSGFDGVDRAWVVVRGNVTVRNVSGFERVEDGDLTRLRWTGADRAGVSLVVTGDFERADTTPVADGSWAFGPLPFVELQWATGGSVSRSWPLRDAVGDATSGVAGDRYVLLGDHDVIERRAPAQRFRLIVPADESVAADRAAVGDALVNASWRLDVGDRDPTVLGFAVPGSRPGGEAVPRYDEFWVDAESSLSSPENVWLHEYVHTRQSFVLATEMVWFREASAEYYATRLSYEEGLIDSGTMREKLGGSPSDATLTDPGSWTDRQVPRRKGARALAVLDRKIRAETFGHRSLEDVFARLNRHDGTVTYRTFVRTVSAVAGEPMDEWLDRHVASDDPVADEYGARAGVGAPTVLGRLWTDPAGVFLTLSAGLSVVAAVPLYGLLDRIERRRRNESPAATRREPPHAG